MPVLAVRTCPFKRRRHPRPKSRKVWESLVKQRLEVSSTAEGCTGRRGEGPKPRSGWPSGLPRVRLEADRLPVGAYFGFCSSHCDFIRQTISLLPECRAEALLARLRSVSYRIISQSIWRAVMFQLGRKCSRSKSHAVISRRDYLDNVYIKSFILFYGKSNLIWGGGSGGGGGGGGWAQVSHRGALKHLGGCQISLISRLPALVHQVIKAVAASKNRQCVSVPAHRGFSG